MSHLFLLTRSPTQALRIDRFLHATVRLVSSPHPGRRAATTGQGTQRNIGGTASSTPDPAGDMTRPVSELKG